MPASDRNKQTTYAQRLTKANTQLHIGTNSLHTCIRKFTVFSLLSLSAIMTAFLCWIISLGLSWLINDHVLHNVDLHFSNRNETGKRSSPEPALLWWIVFPDFCAFIYFTFSPFLLLGTTMLCLSAFRKEVRVSKFFSRWIPPFKILLSDLFALYLWPFLCCTFLNGKFCDSRIRSQCHSISKEDFGKIDFIEKKKQIWKC